MRRCASRAALAGLGVSVSLVLAGCSSSGTAAAPARTQPTATSAAATSTPTTSAPSADPSVALCTAYAGATGNPRQVVTTSSTKPVLGPAVALVLVSFRGIVAGADVPADPALQQSFTELLAAVDDLSDQLTKGLPPGADAVSTPVAVNPARFKAALDTADGLCTARGVSPKAG